MKIKNLKTHWILICVVSVMFFLLVMRSIRKTESIDNFGDVQKGRFLNKAEQARAQALLVMVDDLQKQLFDAQKYEKQLIRELEHIDAKRKRKPHNQTKKFPVKGMNVNFNNLTGILANGDDSLGLLGCKDTNKIKIIKTVGKGFTKIVQEGQINGMQVAVKSAGLEVKDVQDCLKSGMYKKEEDCFVLASYKVLKEAMMLKQLKHPNIVKLLGLCLRSEKSSPHIQERGMTEVVEFGERINIQELALLPYQDRVQLCIGVAQLLLYLAESPLGSVAILDFREDQFVLYDKQIKLSDVDDLSSNEPDCNSKMECLINNSKTNIKCASNMKCPGLNVKANLAHACRVFFEPLLGFEGPIVILEKSKNILMRIRHGVLDTKEVTEELIKLNSVMLDKKKHATQQR